jgi:hypothetical protein
MLSKRDELHSLASEEATVCGGVVLKSGYGAKADPKARP